MNKNEIKKIIKKDIMSSTPDVLHKIDLSKITIEPLTIKENKKSIFSKMLTIKYAMAFIIVLVCGIIVFNNNGVKPFDEDKKPVYEDIEEIYTYSLVSGASLLSSMTSTMELDLNYNNLLDNKNKWLIEDEVEDLTIYLTTIEKLIGSKDSIVINSNEVSDITKYEYKVSYQTLNLVNDPVDFEIYYNEKTIDITKTSINGIMISEGIEYSLEGIREIIDDETNIKFKAYQSDNLQNYVLVKQVIENNEQKFIYEIYEDQSLINKCEIKLENNEDDIVANLLYENNDSKSSYKFQRDYEEGIELIKINYKIESLNKEEKGQIRVKVRHDTETDEYQYQYHINTNNQEKDIVKERKNKGNKNSHDDDKDKKNKL